MIRPLAAAALLALALPTAAQAQGLDLTVEGVRNDRGAILVLVFDRADAYDQLDYLSAVDYAEIPARAGTVSHRFAGLTAGPYAVFLFHDENGDQDLNYTATAFLEGFGASGAPNPADEPSFAEAAVPPGPVTVKLHY